MYLLDKLWRGDIAPSERYIRPDSEFKRKAKEFCDAAERLVEGLSPEGKQHWEDVERLKHDMNMLDICPLALGAHRRPYTVRHLKREWREHLWQLHHRR